MMLVQSGVFAMIFAAGTQAEKYFKYTLSVLHKNIFLHETAYSRLGYYLAIICLAVTILIFLVQLINGCTVIKKALIIIGIVYCVPLLIVVYVAFLMLASLSPQTLLIHIIFAAVCGLILLVLIIIFFLIAKKNRARFLKEYR
jgi:FtsH-binding integral membrane protein